ncbi:Syntaxin-1A [Gonapodya sp. JEL0774]|nr:Syntaxin-1A [Gonapodya sp. JEL0774]
MGTKPAESPAQTPPTDSKPAKSGKPAKEKEPDANAAKMKEFFEEVGIVRDAIATLKRDIDSVEPLHGKAMTATSEAQQSDISKDIGAIMDRVQSQSNKIRAKLKGMEAANKKFSKESGPGSSDARIRESQQIALSKKFVEHMTEYKDLQQKYQGKIKQRMKREIMIGKLLPHLEFHRAGGVSALRRRSGFWFACTLKLTPIPILLKRSTKVKPDATDAEINQAMESGTNGIFAQQMLKTSKQTEEARAALVDIQNRHEEIIRIEKTVLELQQLFMDMAVLVAAQEEQIIEISENVGKTVDNTEKGVQELRKANKMQKRSRKSETGSRLDRAHHQPSKDVASSVSRVIAKSGSTNGPGSGMGSPPSDPREQSLYYKRLYDRLLGQHTALRESHEALRKELDEFTTDSRALEEELESEVKRLERDKDEAHDKIDVLRREGEEAKTKLTSFQIESQRTINQLAQDLDNLRYHQKRDRERMRGLEIANDELERLTRAAQAEIEDLKSRYNQTLERNVFLQHEAEMLEQLQTELQRVKDELRDAHTELEIRRAAKLSRASLLVGSPVANTSSATSSLSDTLHHPAPSSIATDQSGATTAGLPTSLSTGNMSAGFSVSPPSPDDNGPAELPSHAFGDTPSRSPIYSFGDLDMADGTDDGRAAVERTKRMSTAVGQNVHMLQDLLTKAKGIEQRIAQARAWYISPLLQTGQPFPGPTSDGRASPRGRSPLPHSHIPPASHPSERSSERGPMPAFASALYPPVSNYRGSYDADNASSTGASSYERSVRSFGDRLDSSRGRNDWGSGYASQQLHQQQDNMDDDQGSTWSAGGGQQRGGTPQPGDSSSRRNVPKQEKSRKSVLGAIIPGYSDWVTSAIGKISGDRGRRDDVDNSGSDIFTGDGTGTATPRTPVRSSTGGWFSGRLSRGGFRPGEGESHPDRPPSAGGFTAQRASSTSRDSPGRASGEPDSERRSFSGFQSNAVPGARVRSESASPASPIKKSPSAVRLFGGGGT